MLYADARSSLQQRRQEEEAAAAARVTERLAQAEAMGERHTDGGAEAHAQVGVLLRLLSRVRASRANKKEQAEAARRVRESSPAVTPWCPPTPHSRRRQLHARTVSLVGYASPRLSLCLLKGAEHSKPHVVIS
jgi:hypothetical protein